MSEEAGAPRPEPTDTDGLWVVDVVAPLPPGRVRLVAAEAAARLHLAAEKLVPLLENRIGPVTKPLSLRSARRVAEVLHGAGAEVDMRTARASDGRPSEAREPTPAPPGGVERRGTGVAPSTSASTGAGTVPAAGVEAAPANATARVQDDAERRGQEGTTTDAEDGERDGVSSDRAPRSDGHDDAPSGPGGTAESKVAASAPDAGDDVSTRRSDDPRPADPWRAMSEDAVDDGTDDAMLGAWRRPAARRSPAPARPDSDPEPDPDADPAVTRPEGASGAADGDASSRDGPTAPAAPTSPTSRVAASAPSGPTDEADSTEIEDVGGLDRGRDAPTSTSEPTTERVATVRPQDDLPDAGRARGVAPRPSIGATGRPNRSVSAGGADRYAGGRERRLDTLGDEARASFAPTELAGDDVERDDDASVGAWSVPSGPRRGPTDRVTSAPPASRASVRPSAASGSPARSAAPSTPPPAPHSPSTTSVSAGARTEARTDRASTTASTASTASPSAPSARSSSSSAAGARSEPAPRAATVQLNEPSPLPTAVREQDDVDEDYGFGFGMRDPFAEEERRDRATRRSVLAGVLVVALVAFFALQWVYSRPNLAGAEPPPYAEGLLAYRDGAFVSAARAWTPRAEAGDAEAMYMLGYMAEIGQGRPWSNAEAASWYRQAADRGHAPAQLRLAALHRAGMGVAYDDDAALRLTLAAAEAGLAPAQLEAARLLAGVGRHEEAFSWLRRAAAREPEAAGWLGLTGAVRGMNRSSE